MRFYLGGLVEREYNDNALIKVECILNQVLYGYKKGRTGWNGVEAGLVR